MAAGCIREITVEINGDTTGLSKALSGVNKEIRSTQSQLPGCGEPAEAGEGYQL